MPGLAVGLVQHPLGPAVGLQLHPGGAVLHRGVGSRVRLQPGHLLPQRLRLPAALLQGLLRLSGGLLPLAQLGAEGGQFALTALHAAQQFFLLPLQGPLLLLQRLLLGAELVPLPFGPADALLQLLALLGILPGQGLQIIQHILPVKAAEDGVSELMVHGAPRFLRPRTGADGFV